VPETRAICLRHRRRTGGVAGDLRQFVEKRFVPDFVTVMRLQEDEVLLPQASKSGLSTKKASMRWHQRHHSPPTSTERFSSFLACSTAFLRSVRVGFGIVDRIAAGGDSAPSARRRDENYSQKTHSARECTTMKTTQDRPDPPNTALPIHQRRGRRAGPAIPERSGCRASSDYGVVAAPPPGAIARPLFVVASSAGKSDHGFTFFCESLL